MNHKFISRDIDHSLTVICSDLCIFQSDTQFIIQTLYLTPVQGNTLCRLCVLEKSYQVKHQVKHLNYPINNLICKSTHRLCTIVYGLQIRQNFKQFIGKRKYILDPSNSFHFISHLLFDNRKVYAQLRQSTFPYWTALKSDHLSSTFPSILFEGFYLKRFNSKTPVVVKSYEI